MSFISCVFNAYASFGLKRCSPCARRRTTSCNTDAEIEPSSISASVSLRTTSCGMRTPPLNPCVQLQRHRTTSCDIIPHRPMSYDVVRCRTMSYDVVRCVNTALAYRHHGGVVASLFTSQWPLLIVVQYTILYEIELVLYLSAKLHRGHVSQDEHRYPECSMCGCTALISDEELARGLRPTSDRQLLLIHYGSVWTVDQQV